jgi:dipeptidyl aminopeptidase/acylaminoacyl peptidase
MRPAAFALSLVAAALATGSPALTIDQLIDIKHPSNPVWSRDSARIAFTWERAGVASLYVVPADGSSAPAQVTTDGVPGGYFWSADSQAIEFFRGGALMAIPAAGGPAKTVTDLRGRAPAISRDGTRVAYLMGGAGGARSARGARGAQGAGGAQGATGGDGAPVPPTEIHVRSLADGSDGVVARWRTDRAISWISDNSLGLSAGGNGETIRHEQTPDYSARRSSIRSPRADSQHAAVRGCCRRRRRALGTETGGFGGRGELPLDRGAHF